MGGGTNLSPELVHPGDDSPWVFGDAASATHVVPLADGPAGSRAATVMPIAPSTGGRPLGFIVVRLSPLLSQALPDVRFQTLLAASVSQNVTNAIAAEEKRKRLHALAELDRAKTAFFSNVQSRVPHARDVVAWAGRGCAGGRGIAVVRSAGTRQVVHRNALRLSKLANTLLDFSRIEAGRVDASFEPTNLGVLTKDLASMFAPAIERGGLSPSRCSADPITSPNWSTRRPCAPGARTNA